MDTPERSKVGGTPISKFEDSPIFNFINNLSPIQPVKSVNGAQLFPSLSYASISSVFSSPHVNSQKESRFLIRQPFSYLSKFEIASEGAVETNLCPDISNATKLSSCSVVAQEKSNIACVLNEATVDPPDESSTQPSNLTQVHYDSSSPYHNTAPSYGIKSDLKFNTDLALIEVVPDGFERRKVLFATEVDLQEKSQDEGSQDEGSKEEVTGYGWEDLISDGVDEMLIFDTSIVSETSKGQIENLVAKANKQTSSISRHVDVIDIPPNTQPDIAYGSCLQKAAEGPALDNNGEAGKQHVVDNTPQILSPTSQKHAVNDQTQKIGEGNNGCISLGCEVDSQIHRGMRRRCLVFEVSGVSGKNSNNNSTLHPSVSLPSTGKFTSDDRHLTLSRTGSSLSPHMLPGIGLHLNTLAAISKNRMVTPETLSSGRHLVSMPCTISPFPPLTASQTFDAEKDQFTGSDVQDLEGVHSDSSEVPTVGLGEDLNHISPKKKKRKSDNVGESEACKRCNCKKSKCLKLYCECFAAGVYCVEPCSCQGCFNKPVHEETVLATRKQIESRNPLAFAPKVIQASEPLQDTGIQEETNKTPASARHKRGCNCKKSSCLKKYCECYQAGVGCSASCRCEACKNAFGRKDSGEEIEHVEEEMDDCEEQRDKPDDGQQNAVAHDNENPFAGNILPVTPCFQICSPSVKMPFLSSGKPPRSSTSSIRYQTSQMLKKCDIPLPRSKIDKYFKAAPEDDTPEILRNDSSPSTGVKTSPNGKRVSPPHIGLGMSPNRKGGRKLILKSIPSFPSLCSTVSDDYTVNYSVHPH